MTQPLTRRVSRRSLLKSAAASSVAFTIVPRHVLGGAGVIAPSERVRMAGIGCGGMGGGDIGTFTEKVLLHLLRKIITCLFVRQIEPVLVDQHFLLL